jgi:serine/threonine protein kinase/Tfp pilus assembly protein PilF
MPFSPGTSLGRYEIVDLVGSGGMGEVYRARDPQLGRTVALKTIRAAPGDAAATRRLMTEARAAAALSHPNIAQIYDVGESNGIPYVAMEYVEGELLEAKLAQGPLPVTEVLGLGLALANALAEAHRRGVVHRDIKPGNIIITPDGHPKLLDFGIAKLQPLIFSPGEATLGQTQPGVVLGTVDYMSPEQALAEEVGPSTDVFSLGVVLYRIAAGVLPFSAQTAVAVIYQILNHHPAPLTQFRADLPLELQQVIRRCLEKTASARFANGSALAQALARIPAPEQVRADQRIPIAVLPFADVSAGKDNEYFSAGLTDEITVDLSSLRSLAVVSRTSASRYRGTSQDIRAIAAELNVRYVLEGTVRKAGDAVRITAQLVDAVNDSPLWSGKYKGTLEDVFEIQEEVARQIVDALRVTLTPAEKVTLEKRSTSDAAAFDLYLRGRHLLGAATKKDLQQALPLFEAALARDPRYAAAYAGVAEACAAYYEYYDRRETWLDRAIESALKALAYDSRLPEASAALGLAYFNKGTLQEALAACRRAIELDPANYIGYWILGRIDYVTGRTEDAIALLEKVVELNPEFYPAYFTLRMVCQSVGKETIYLPHMFHLVDEVFPRYLTRNPDDARARNTYGTELTQAGRAEQGLLEVQRALSEAGDDPLILYASACYFARFGDRALAVDLLRQALAAGFTNFAYLEQDPDLRSLHMDPGYQELIRSGGHT